MTMYYVTNRICFLHRIHNWKSLSVTKYHFLCTIIGSCPDWEKVKFTGLQSEQTQNLYWSHSLPLEASQAHP
jgi:hypothetical protein